MTNLTVDINFKEADHPRGQPGNAGQFSATASGTHGSTPSHATAQHYHSKSTDVPADLHGVKLSPWHAPKDKAGWAEVAGQKPDLKEPPPLDLAKGMKFSAGVLIQEPDGRVWVVKPKHAFGGYKYTFPKGGVSKGLSPQATAIKEAYEETGLHAEITGYAGDHKGDTSVTRYYLAKRIGGTPLDHGWESEGVSLIHPDQLHDFLNRSRDRAVAHEHLGAVAPVHAAPATTSPTAHQPAGESAPGMLPLSSLHKVGHQLGSNPGGVYENAAGKRYYVKLAKSADHAKNEHLAARLYAMLGVPVLANRLVDTGGGKLGTATEWVEKQAYNQQDPHHVTEARKNFAAHALLANWDAAGLDLDNQAMVNGKMTTLDPGGSLIYRAQGGPKGAAFGNTVGEWDSLRDPHNGPTTIPFRGMDAAEMKASAERIAKVPMGELRQLVMRHGPGSEADRSALADKLEARHADLMKRAGIK